VAVSIDNQNDITVRGLIVVSFGGSEFSQVFAAGANQPDRPPNRDPSEGVWYVNAVAPAVGGGYDVTVELRNLESTWA
jgi:hypothetical protein